MYKGEINVSQVKQLIIGFISYIEVSVKRIKRDSDENTMWYYNFLISPKWKFIFKYCASKHDIETILLTFEKTKEKMFIC